MPTSDQTNRITRAIGRYLAGVYSGDVGLQEMHLSGTGVIAELESRLCNHYGMKHALTVSNATTGLFLIGIALDLHGVSFITSPYTYGGSLAGWMMLGNKPTFCDIEADILALSADDARNSITTRTKALLTTDIYGIPADMESLRKLADEHGLWLISDAAQSLGAKRNGKPASSQADALVVSFTIGKTVSVGEGGAILTNNSDLYEKLLWYGSHPYRQKRELGLNLQNEVAFNCRPHPLSVIWANSIFDEALKKLKARQRECLRIIRVLNAIGLTETIDFEDRDIMPSFFRLTAAWNSRAQEKRLVKAAMMDFGLNLSLSAAPVRLLYRQPAFIAQYGQFLNRSRHCPEAERQEKIRFCINS